MPPSPVGFAKNGGDGVPRAGMGTFYTEYGNDGKMVGGFGVNCDIKGTSHPRAKQRLKLKDSAYQPSPYIAAHS